ncbi:hypothetical protein GGR54DRAFT_607136 [Hypoxylon sp. NC1633]|nr:hypothetical protein GGR54DRAFT_607136 [Hypoxylon sp. NC1633]
MTGNVWFISGATSGFGKVITIEAIKRGDSVIASSRKATADKELADTGALLVDLDVLSADAEIQAAFQQGEAKFGPITHFINAAGYVLQGPVEGASSQEALDSLRVNVLGVMNMARNEVALLRPRGHGGVIANFGSIVSWAGCPAAAHYSAAKWAVSGFTESLHLEVKAFGIKAVIIEPGYFRTPFLNEGGGNRILTKNQMQEEYAGTSVEQVSELFEKVNDKQPGDVVKGAKVIVDVLTGTGGAAGKETPMRLPLGVDGMQYITEKIISTQALLDEWKPIITSTDHDDVKKA